LPLLKFQPSYIPQTN